MGADSFPEKNHGPHGLGDPNDRRLRKVEMNVLIPKKMRDKARLEKCVAEVEEFTKCCKDNGLMLVTRCQEPNGRLKECLAKWFFDPQFREFCTEEYLSERAEYRRTGLTMKQRKGLA